MTRFDGIELPNIVQRRFDVRMTESKTKLDVLTTRLAKARHLKAFEHLTIYAAGSYGRLEASKYSDIDLFFVLAKPRSYFDEIRVPEIRLLSEIVEIGYDMDFPKFSNDGHFLKLLFLDDTPSRAEEARARSYSRRITVAGTATKSCSVESGRPYR
ncbi:nucleotidyltransferase domain-containing protein [Bradyrhizobium sp. BRP23]|uniref:nucleotidyltransferase domain-containing protein n=1 Tax=Bradyrhizobium sp. BRP23 TaxID=2793820 RepID=UPI001CD678E3|nr:nucleotidyltransferase domain-containing protein [Bradyrhizobium sp. BRP23]MCA1381087.1 nucleotidyltransferase domain-containing protein [Bradyrhizobium sp. BRP05]MCA1418792.1 nucleotidyltransferase domain-containing protein [Bradyrhizobium sp. BRP23]